MTDEKEIFAAWIADCKKKIRDLQEADLTQSGSFNAVLGKLLTPYHYFKMDYHGPFGSDSGGAGEERERSRNEGLKSAPAAANTEGARSGAGRSATAKPKCVDCKKEFEPRVKGAVRCLDCWKKKNPRRLP